MLPWPFPTGVLWSGDTLFPHTVETLDLLRARHKTIVFVTNNSTKSRADYIRKLASMGIPATVEEVFGSSYSAAVYIARILPKSHPELATTKRTVFVIGESGIEQELDAENVPHIGGSDAAFQRDMTPEDYTAIAAGDPSVVDPTVGVVLVGLDFHFNYLKMALAYHYLCAGALFLATNIDSTIPSAGALFPGAGTMAAPLITMVGKEPVALGKPSQAMMDAVEGKFKFDRNKACMVGDRANTDIKFGLEGRLGGTLAVLTGVSSKEEFFEAETRPAAYVDKLSDLLEGA
jgi:4-nitrophenyl phosphatase